MGYHAINESSNITVYSRSSCDSESVYGTLYNGEVFTFIKEHNGYLDNYEIRFLSSSGGYSIGYINTGQYGNLAYSGERVTEEILECTCYRFRLRTSLKVVSSTGGNRTILYAGDYIYTRSATAGESNPENMHIIGYKKGIKDVISYSGFLTLDYTVGSTFSENFCIYKE